MSETSPEVVVLPPDGTIVEVSPWRRQFGWVLVVVFGVLYLTTAVKALQLATTAGFGLAAFCLAMMAWTVRLPLSGMILEPDGIKVRRMLWTFHWRWEEIERFELRPKGYPKRFRIHLRGGGTRKVRGFFADSSSEEAKGQLLFKALQDRLEAETGRQRETAVVPDLQPGSLPPDGHAVRIRPVRWRDVWVRVAGFGLGIGAALAYALHTELLLALFLLPSYVIAAFVYGRLALSGLVLEAGGVKLRGLWRARHLRWDEIEGLELHEEEEALQLRIHLREGKAQDAPGFFAETPDEKARAQTLFKALRERLEAERLAAPAGPTA